LRTIAAVTVDRSDWGIFRPVLRRVVDHADLGLHLVVTGTHLDARYGETVLDIEGDGFAVDERVVIPTRRTSAAAVAERVGRATLGLAEVFGRVQPDLLLLLGDRVEMHAAAVAALPFRIPVAHIHGGELTLGAVDDALRHSITKLSHLHFVATEEYGRRVQQLGEEASRITVSGAPGLDNIGEVELLEPGALSEAVGLPLDPAPLLVTYHPETLGAVPVEEQIAEMLAALDLVGRPVIFTGTNADAGGRRVLRAIDAHVEARPDCVRVQHLSTAGYFSAMRHCAAMVGNSSSGIIEAASFELPVVNVGGRQEGRARGINVIDVGPGREAIASGIRRATDPQFAASLRGMSNPYGDGRASERIVRRLAAVPLEDLVRKPFVDWPEGP